MSLFAPTQKASASMSIFTQPQQQQQVQNQQPPNAFQTSNLFNQSQAQQQSQQQQQQQQPQQQQIQQQQQQPQLNASFMNASQAPAQRLGGSLWEPLRDSPNQKPIEQQMEAVFRKWNPADPGTEFKFYFYNKVDSSRVPFYAPSPAEDQQEWERALRDKPGQDYIPVLATGFRAVGERLKMQKEMLAQYNSRLHEINSALDAILSKHDLETSVRAVNARRKHLVLRQRCLALATRVQVLRNRGYALDTDEDELKTKLEHLDRGMADPALSARTEELWSRLIQLRRHADTLQGEINARGGDGVDGISPEAEQTAKSLLEKYDKQLQDLTRTVNKVKKDYEEWQKERHTK